MLRAWREATGLEIRDGYGQTETGQLTGTPPRGPARAGSMGVALPGMRLTLSGGELTVDPASVPTFFLGYLGEDVRRAPDGAWLVSDRAAAGPWPTGDRVREDDDGWLYFEGRNDDVIVSAGYRIGPFEVESALVAHPAVAEAAAVAAPDEERGAVVRAVVVLRDGHDPSPELARELQEHVKRETAPYKYPRISRLRRRPAEDRLGQDQARGAARGVSRAAAAERTRGPAPVGGPHARGACVRAVTAGGSGGLGYRLGVRSAAAARVELLDLFRGGDRGRAQHEEGREDAARDADRCDDVGEVVAAGQRFATECPLALSALAWSVAIVPSDARPIAPNSCTDTLMMPDASPASRAGASDMPIVSSGRNEAPAPRPSARKAKNRPGK